MRLPPDEASFGALIDIAIYRVVQESLSNAVRHGNAAEIFVSVTPGAGGPRPDCVTVEVSNDGAGMDKTAGFGFGLTGMRERVRALGGRLVLAHWAWSLGHCNLSRSRGKQPSSRLFLRGRRMKVLIVDDHPIVRAGLRRLITVEPDVEICEAATAREALTSFKEDPPDLVIMDLNLPGTGGLETIRRLIMEDDFGSHPCLQRAW